MGRISGIFILCLLSWLPAPPAAGVETPDWRMLAERWLSASFPEPGTRWTAHILQAPPATDGEGRILGSRMLGRKAKRIMALMVQIGTGPDARTGRLVIQAARRWTVAVAVRPVKRGEPLGSADWRWEERDAAGLAADAVRSGEQLAGKQARKHFAAGEPLTAHALESVPDVRTGARIALRVRGEGVLISTEARALENGRTGDMIRLQAEGTRRRVIACLIGPETAEIVLTRRH